MSKKYVKSLKEYDDVEFDEDSVSRVGKVRRKMPTSVSLPPEVVEEFKRVPYMNPPRCTRHFFSKRSKS